SRIDGILGSFQSVCRLFQGRFFHSGRLFGFGFCEILFCFHRGVGGFGERILDSARQFVIVHRRFDLVGSRLLFRSRCLSVLFGLGLGGILLLLSFFQLLFDIFESLHGLGEFCGRLVLGLLLRLIL